MIITHFITGPSEANEIFIKSKEIPLLKRAVVVIVIIAGDDLSFHGIGCQGQKVGIG